MFSHSLYNSLYILYNVYKPVNYTGKARKLNDVIFFEIVKLKEINMPNHKENILLKRNAFTLKQIKLYLQNEIYLFEVLSNENNITYQ